MNESSTAQHDPSHTARATLGLRNALRASRRAERKALAEVARLKAEIATLKASQQHHRSLAAAGA